jgi:MFS transporter, CP family, cyanate transporter
MGAVRVLTASVGLVAVGCLSRMFAVFAALMVGTTLLGLGIGVAGVCLAGLVRTHFATRAGLLTGGYVTAMLVGATAASASAVPLTTVLGGWSTMLASWAAPALSAMVLWIVVTRGLDRERGSAEARGIERMPRLGWVRRFSGARGFGGMRVFSGARAFSESWEFRRAWEFSGTRAAECGGRVGRRHLGGLAAVYLSGASLTYYGWLIWLPAYYLSKGWDAGAAGRLLAVFSITQIPGALFAPMLAERCGRWRFWSGAALTLVAAGMLGVLLAPVPPLVGPWLWATSLGLGAGAGFPLGMTAIAWHSRGGEHAATLSGRATGTGYLVAGIGPFVMGLLVDAFGDYRWAFAVLGVVAVAQIMATARIGNRPAPQEAPADYLI